MIVLKHSLISTRVELRQCIVSCYARVVLAASIPAFQAGGTGSNPVTCFYNLIGKYSAIILIWRNYLSKFDDFKRLLVLPFIGSVENYYLYEVSKW